jgi:hypothetical protein
MVEQPKKILDRLRVLYALSIIPIALNSLM